MHRQWNADLENISVRKDNGRLKLIKIKLAHCVSLAKRKWFFYKTMHTPFPHPLHAVVQQDTSILLQYINVCSYIGAFFRKKKQQQDIQPAIQNIWKTLSLWPSATRLKQKAANTVIMASAGVLCGILINQLLFSFQYKKKKKPPNTKIWLTFLRNMEGKCEFICGIH